jgi:lipid-binding SYLF domain-containing protein
MRSFRTSLLGLSLLPALTAAPLQAGNRELATVESAAEVVQALSAVPLRCIPPALMQNAKGVIVVPNVVKAGLVFDGRFGRGVLLLHQPDGGWSNPVFVTLAGGGFGWQAGIQSTDLVLIFKTEKTLERILRGKSKLTLGGDASIAAGPVGREAEAATDLWLKAEVYSYSRSRGLFAGVALKGDGLLPDCDANETFYRIREGRPEEVLAFRGPVPVAVQRLKEHLVGLSAPPAPPVVVFPPQIPPPPFHQP